MVKYFRQSSTLKPLGQPGTPWKNAQFVTRRDVARQPRCIDPRQKPLHSLDMKGSGLLLFSLLLVCLLTGCVSDGMTYAQWQHEQENRRKAEAAGQPYKTPSQLRAEAQEMRQAVQETQFETSAK